MCAALAVACISSALALPAAAAEKPPACRSPEHRQFDFWLGEWDVRDPAGKSVGRNRIVTIHGGCALQENWTGAGGVSGTSLNAYDAEKKRWHQTWVDSSGGVLQLDGGIVGGAMVLVGESVTADTPPATVRQRVTWTKLPDDRVRQLWERSGDAGATWTTVFDGTYSKVP